MNYKIKDELLTISLEGRLDTEAVVNVEKEISSLCNDNPHQGLCFDATNLEYIASSGLRVVLKFAKAEKNFSLINVQENIYNVFSMTGFTKIMKITKALRRINLEECEMIGFGGTGAVYRVSEDEIVKVNYNPDTFQHLDIELNKAKEAFLLGIPTAISFDMVDCGEGKRGVIYETIKSITLGETIQKNPERMEELTDRYIEQLNKLHSIRTDNPIFGSAKEGFRKQAEGAAKYLTPEEVELLYKILEALPEGDVLVHCDAHPKNLMIQNGEMMWIDMEMMSLGHPIYDLISIAVVLAAQMNEELAFHMSGMKLDTLKSLNRCFIQKYFKTETEEEFEKYLSLMNMLRIIRSVFALGIPTPGSAKYSGGIVALAREAFFPKVDEIIAGIKYLTNKLNYQK